MTNLANPLSDAHLRLSVPSIIRAFAERTPSAPALLAPGRPALSYNTLNRLVKNLKSRLARMGVSRHERIAIVMPNGAEMAATFLATSAAATCAPLSPSCSRREFDFYLSDLRAKALIVQAGEDSPARAAANAAGIAILELSPVRGGEAGLFEINANTKAEANDLHCAQPDDIALVLYTSGTTSRPKLVPLSHRNICASARNISDSLRLEASDCCLNVMPLFHVHGLIAAVLSSLAAGSQVICAPGFDNDAFFVWLRELRPTWYTAVPTIHQAVLGDLGSRPSLVSGHTLRFVRSATSALAPTVFENLEMIFKVPVIESYGMTEAAAQITSNPLPPSIRKCGSVGLPAGPELAIVDDSGRRLALGQTGEVVIRGENVIAAYHGNPRVNRSGFRDGWLRTGDLGHLDQEGYLFLTGRATEMINRGGEKISPREIDDTLLQHPAVKQVAAFGAPHSRLGQDVLAAVVLEAGSTVSESDLRGFALARLGEHKVPSRFLLVDDIPTTQSGKVQRSMLMARYAGEIRPPYAAPRTPLEASLVALWAELLVLEDVGIDDNFFTLGGDSLRAAQMLAGVRKRHYVSFDARILLEAPTIAELAARILGRQSEAAGWKDAARTLDAVEASAQGTHSPDN